MRKKIVAGNWKMNKNLDDGIALVNSIIEKLGTNPSPNVETIIAPPNVLLSELRKVLGNENRISLSAQNCSDKPFGAYTGEVSASMLKSVGCSYVLIGHSERRQYFLENNLNLSEKVNQVLQNNMIPIYCCGEVLEERQSENYFNVVKNQIEEGLFHLSEENFSKIIIAYEPVWAIGTGLTASPDQAQEIHSFIRKLIFEKYGKAISDLTVILYGGSCNPTNAPELFSQKDVDGGLIGGAALKSDDFVKIINSF